MCLTALCSYRERTLSALSPKKLKFFLFLEGEKLFRICCSYNCYLCGMDNICFLSDFPSEQEEKYYKEIAIDTLGKYHVYTGGNYVCIKNVQGRTVRFTSRDVRNDIITNDQVNHWVERLHKMHPQF